MSQLGRISGPLLKSNLIRNGVNLAFETDLLYLDVNNKRIGINVANPNDITAALTVNGTTRTGTINITSDNIDIGNINISGSTITSSTGTLNLAGSAGGLVVYQSKLLVDDLKLENNTISTTASNANLELRPHGSGTVDIYGNTNVTGNITATGNISADGNIQIGSTNQTVPFNDTVTFNAKINSNVIPSTTDLYSLGSSDKHWKELWVQNLYSQTVTADSLVINGINPSLTQGNIVYVAKNGNDSKSGTHQNDPFATVGRALSTATSGTTVYIYPGTYTEIFPLTIPAGVTVKGAGLRSVRIVPTVGTNTETVFLLNGDTTVEDLTIADFYSPGYAFKFVTGVIITNRSPYIRNVTVLTKGTAVTLSDPLGFNSGNAGKGAFVDGSVANISSKEASMLFHSVTFVCPGVDVLVATNGARIEWLNSFTYFAYRSIYLYSSSTGFAGAGKTRIKITSKTGTWAVGNTLTSFAADGSTVLATGTINSIDGDFYNIDGRVLGFDTVTNRPGKTVTVHGDAKLSSSVYKYGTASLALDGTGDYLSIATQPDFAFGTGDFTVEAWVYPTVGSAYRSLFDFRSAAIEQSIYLGINTSNQLYLYVNGVITITTAATVSLSAWTHVALVRSSGTTKIYLNGTQSGSSWVDITNYGTTKPLRIGADWSAAYGFTGYIDDVRIEKGVAKYTANFTAPAAALLPDNNTVLMLHFDGANNAIAMVDDGYSQQDIRTSAGGRATIIDFADYSDFGTEFRSIGSASVYGTYGIVGDGVGVVGYLISHNLAYVGAGKLTTNDPNDKILANQVVKTNAAQIYYTYVDNDGNFNVGERFSVNQKTGEVTFSNSNVTFGTSLTFNNGLGNITYVDASKIETGNFRISGNTIQTISQDFNVTAASNLINLQSNVHIAGNLDVVGNVTIAGNITIGDQTTDTVSFVAGVNSDILPTTTSTYNLGSPSLQWKGIYATEADIGSIRIDSNVITTIDSSSNLELRANGSGKILVPSNNVELTQNLTVNGTTNTKDVNITGTVTQTGDVVQTGTVTQTGNLNVTGRIAVSGDAQFNDILISGNSVATTIGNDNLNLSAHGTGKVIVPTANVLINNNLTVNGLATIATLTTPNTVTAGTFATGDILISQNYITTTQSNSNLELIANGSGKIIVPLNDVQLAQQLQVVGTTTTADVTIVGTLSHTGATTQTGNSTQTGDFTLTGNLTVNNTAQFKDVQIDNNVITTTIGNNNLQLLAAGAGRVLVPSNNVEISNGLTVTGTSSTTTINNTGTVTSGTFSTGNIQVTSNTISTTVTNSNLELIAAGTGKITVPTNNVQFGQTLQVSGTTTLGTTGITGTLTHTGNKTHTGNTNQTGNFVLTGNLTVNNTAQFKDVKIDNNVITTTIGTNDLLLQASGTGKVLVPSNNVLINQTLTVVGTSSTSNITNTGTVTSGTFSTGDITVNSNVITTTVSNSNLELQASGSGKVYVPNNNVQLDQTLTVLGLSTLGNTTIVGTVTQTGATTQTGNVTQTGTYTLNGNLTVSATAQFSNIQIDNNVITTTVTNSDLELRAAGTGRIYVPSNNVTIDQNLTVTGTTTTSIINNSGTITAATFNDGDITISSNIIQTTATNSNLQLRAAGTGFIELEQFEIQDNTIRISAANTDLILQPNGTGIVSINSNQALKLPAGTGNSAYSPGTGQNQRPVTPTEGMIRFNTTLARYEGYNGITWVRLDGVEDADGNTKITAELTPGANDNTIRFYTNGTQVADLNSTRLNVNRITAGDIDITGNTISTTVSNQNLILAPNGTGAVNTGNFSFKNNTITNTVNNSITYVNQTGDGYFKINSTGGFVIPTGLTEQRPVLFAVGMMRYNVDPGNFRVEIWDGSNWINAGQGAGGGVSAAEAQDIGILSAIIFG
jgi:hypothetical protein